MRTSLFLFCIVITTSIANSCGLNNYFKQQQKFGQNRFIERKNALKSLGFVGNIVSKKYCDKCAIDAYKYSLIVKYRSNDSSIYYTNGSFYAIEEDTLRLSVTKEIYTSVTANDSIQKRNEANTIEINRMSFILLSDKASEWFPNQERSESIRY